MNDTNNTAYIKNLIQFFYLFLKTNNNNIKTNCNNGI